MRSTGSEKQEIENPMQSKSLKASRPGQAPIPEAISVFVSETLGPKPSVTSRTCNPSLCFRALPYLSFTIVKEYPRSSDIRSLVFTNVWQTTVFLRANHHSAH